MVWSWIVKAIRDTLTMTGMDGRKLIVLPVHIVNFVMITFYAFIIGVHAPHTGPHSLLCFPNKKMEYFDTYEFICVY